MGTSGGESQNLTGKRNSQGHYEGREASFVVSKKSLIGLTDEIATKQGGQGRVTLVTKQSSVTSDAFGAMMSKGRESVGRQSVGVFC